MVNLRHKKIMNAHAHLGEISSRILKVAATATYCDYLALLTSSRFMSQWQVVAVVL